MQLHALDNQHAVVFAGQAAKQTDYICIECAQLVRLRGGMHRQPHFYHLRPNISCTLHGKSMTHLMLQNHLQQLLPAGEAQLECRFEEIGRIADVVWAKHRLVFEIQCSPISAEEILSRNADYAAAGFQVVWVLHDKRFNQWRLSGAEHALADRPHYFTDMNGLGKGQIYEQLSVNIKGIRKMRLPKLPVDLSAPQRGDFADADIFPRLIQRKIQTCPVSFAGDTIDQCMAYAKEDEQQSDYIQSIFAAEARWHSALAAEDFLSLPISTSIKVLCQRCLVEPYLAVLRLLLEKACK